MSTEVGTHGLGKDQSGHMLSKTKYNRIADCTLDNYTSCVQGPRNSYGENQYFKVNPVLIRTRNSDKALLLLSPRLAHQDSKY